MDITKGGERRDDSPAAAHDSLVLEVRVVSQKAGSAACCRQKFVFSKYLHGGEQKVLLDTTSADKNKGCQEWFMNHPSTGGTFFDTQVELCFVLYSSLQQARQGGQKEPKCIDGNKIQAIMVLQASQLMIHNS